LLNGTLAKNRLFSATAQELVQIREPLVVHGPQCRSMLLVSGVIAFTSVYLMKESFVKQLLM